MENPKGSFYGSGLEIIYITFHSVTAKQFGKCALNMYPHDPQNGFGEKLGSLYHKEPRVSMEGDIPRTSGPFCKQMGCSNQGILWLPCETLLEETGV